MNKKIKIISLTTIIVLSCIINGQVLAGSATLNWNPNTESDLAGYNVYYGTSPRTGTNPKTCAMCGYTTKVNAGKVTTYTFSNLTNDATYYFSISAYDTSGNESAFSGEVSKLICSSGDLDCSGSVGAADIQLAINVFLGTETRSEIISRSDLNKDGKINVVDIQRVVNITLGK